MSKTTQTEATTRIPTTTVIDDTIVYTAPPADDADLSEAYAEYVNTIPADVDMTPPAPAPAATSHVAIARPAGLGIADGGQRSSEDRVAALRERMEREARELAHRLSSNTVDHIKFKGSSNFLFPDQTTAKVLDVVIVAWMNTNTFYDDTFRPGVISAPKCYAVSRHATGMEPRANSPEPQHTDCDTCPKNQFKSGSNGKGKACRNARHMHVLVVESGGTIASAKPYTLDVPPSSLRSFDRYVQQLGARYNAMPLAVVSRLTLDPETTFASLQFEMERPLDTDQIVAVYDMVDGVEEALDKDIDFSSFAKR